MPKLYFRYGTMNSSKTANLLMVAHNYRKQNKKVITIKPVIDNRFGEKKIVSRAGMSVDADHVIHKNTVITNTIDTKNVSCILVDECQFLTKQQIDELRLLTINTPVICYGLRTDYMSVLFEGSRRLMEIADTIEEIKTICVYCNKKAIINSKFCIDTNGDISFIKTGSPTPEIGGEELYKAICWFCWSKEKYV